jgi:hypothetical protein
MTEEYVINETINNSIIDVKKGHEVQQTECYVSSISEDPKTTNKQAKSVSQKLSLIFASIALGSDGYQANIIGAVESCLTRIYGEKVLANGLSTRVSNALLIGDIVGQLGFGIVIDRMGRKFGIIACTMFVCLVSLNFSILRI